MQADVVEAFPHGTPEEFGLQPEHQSGGEYPEVKDRTVPCAEATQLGGFMSTVELTRFRVEPDREADLIQARPAMLAEFRADRAGFLGARLIRLADGEWLDIVTWRSHEDFVASRAKGANLPGITAFFSAIAELVSSEEGTEDADG